MPDKPKQVLRLWEVVGVDPLNQVMVIYNPAVKKYKDVLLSTGVIVKHPYCNVDYIYPTEHNKKITSEELEAIEKKRQNHFRLIREE
jgi:hypothetical protein